MGVHGRRSADTVDRQDVLRAGGERHVAVHLGAEGDVLAGLADRGLEVQAVAMNTLNELAFGAGGVTPSSCRPSIMLSWQLR